MDTTTQPALTENRSSSGDRQPARWALWGVAAAAAGLTGNFLATHGQLQNADADAAVAATDQGMQHIGTLLGMVSFCCLLVLAAGWRRWAQHSTALAENVVAPALVVTSTLVLLGASLRGALSEYLPGGINEDNFTDEGLYVLFMLHDTAPWFAWWGVLVFAAACVPLAFRRRLLPRWLGVVSALALVPPVAVMAGSGAVAAAGMFGPVWLAVMSLTVALRGMPPVHRGT